MAVSDTYSKTWHEIDDLLREIKRRAREIKEYEILDMADNCSLLIRKLDFCTGSEKEEEKSE